VQWRAALAEMEEQALDGTNYKLLDGRKLGAGAHGSVIRAMHVPSGACVAIKLIPDDMVKKGGQYVLTEIINHSRISHPHVVAFREALSLQSHLGIALDFCNAGARRGSERLPALHRSSAARRRHHATAKADGSPPFGQPTAGDLSSYIARQADRLPEQVARWYFQQIALALDYCHRCGVSAAAGLGLAAAGAALAPGPAPRAASECAPTTAAPPPCLPRWSTATSSPPTSCCTRGPSWRWSTSSGGQTSGPACTPPSSATLAIARTATTQTPSPW
jgi:hypothetical protein